MKQFTYKWNYEIFLLHIQVNCDTTLKENITVIRYYDCKKSIEEDMSIEFFMNSYRFIISRSHPQEKMIKILYPDYLTIDAFLIDDRAYYPTKPFYSI